MFDKHDKGNFVSTTVNLESNVGMITWPSKHNKDWAIHPFHRLQTPSPLLVCQVCAAMLGTGSPRLHHVFQRLLRGWLATITKRKNHKWMTEAKTTMCSKENVPSTSQCWETCRRTQSLPNAPVTTGKSANHFAVVWRNECIHLTASENWVKLFNLQKLHVTTYSGPILGPRPNGNAYSISLLAVCATLGELPEKHATFAWILLGFDFFLVTCNLSACDVIIGQKPWAIFEHLVWTHTETHDDCSTSVKFQNATKIMILHCSRSEKLFVKWNARVERNIRPSKHGTFACEWTNNESECERPYVVRKHDNNSTWFIFGFGTTSPPLPIVTKKKLTCFEGPWARNTILTLTHFDHKRPRFNTNMAGQHFPTTPSKRIQFSCIRTLWGQQLASMIVDWWQWW